MSPFKKKTRLKQGGWLFFLLVCVLSYFTYFHNYQYPAGFFWDENYHIASAQKYLNNVFFMQAHPPLGKMLIAAGGKILGANEVNDQLISTDYGEGEDLPDGFSFAGYRFFSALSGWLTAAIIFLIFLLITRSALSATLLSFLYIFDNALIVHLRGAMLEGPLIFLTSVNILAFFLLLEWKNTRHKFIFAALLSGASLGAAMATKLTALILILLLPALLWKLWPNWRKFLEGFAIFSVGFLVVFIGVWSLHFSIARNVNPDLPNDGYYRASEEYKTILTIQKTQSPLAFPIMLTDSLRFIAHDNSGVPRLDLCKPDENGSPFFFWPFGARSINYRWSTPDGEYYHYLYLQVNPVVWWMSFLGVLTATALIVCSLLFPFKNRLKHRFLMTTFLALYFCYMLIMSQLDRVMYLYHYFIPLIISFILLALVIDEIKQIGRLSLDSKRKTVACFLLAVCIFLSYQLYRPFTYYDPPLTNEQVQSRSLLRLWNLRCVTCNRDDPLVVPREFLP